MKKITMIFMLVATLGLAGCAGPYTGGFIYNNYNAPVDIRDNAVACEKQGHSSMVNVLGYVGLGDASVAKAKASAGITEVGSVDVKFFSVLGLYSKTTTIVCGK